MSFLLSVIFFLALSTSFFFLGKLITWVAYKVNPGMFPNPITPEQISKYTLVGLASCVLWTIVFFGVLQVIN